MRRCGKQLRRVSGKCPSLGSFGIKKDNYICPSWLIWLFYPKARGWQEKEHFSKTLHSWGIWTSKIFTWCLQTIYCKIVKNSHIVITFRVCITHEEDCNRTCRGSDRALDWAVINSVALSGADNLLTLQCTVLKLISQKKLPCH